MRMDQVQEILRRRRLAVDPRWLDATEMVECPPSDYEKALVVSRYAKENGLDVTMIRKIVRRL
jgi:hypothetical protein